jgi:hypothetical protein
MNHTQAELTIPTADFETLHTIEQQKHENIKELTQTIKNIDTLYKPYPTNKTYDIAHITLYSNIEHMLTNSEQTLNTLNQIQNHQNTHNNTQKPLSHHQTKQLNNNHIQTEHTYHTTTQGQWLQGQGWLTKATHNLLHAIKTTNTLTEEETRIFDEWAQHVTLKSEQISQQTQQQTQILQPLIKKYQQTKNNQPQHQPTLLKEQPPMSLPKRNQ